MIVYVETNFLLGIAKGQDSRSDELFSLSADKLRIALPAISIMEAWSYIEAERKRRSKFDEDLQSHIHETSRDLTSAHARSLLASLLNVRASSTNVLNDIEIRLRDTLRKLSQGRGHNRVELLPMTHAVLRQSQRQSHLREPTDNLILAAILHHAKRDRDPQKILLTSNSKDFDTPDIQSLLADAGFIKYLAKTESFLGWFSAQRPQ